MSIDAHRWLMTATKAPMVRTEFRARAGEVVVEIAGCGVCHTDLGYYYDGVRTKQPLPLALGHEISGRVVDAGAGAEGWIGKAVIVPAVIPAANATCAGAARAPSAAARRCRATTSRAASLAHRGAGARPVPGRRGARSPGRRSPSCRSSPTR